MRNLSSLRRVRARTVLLLVLGLSLVSPGASAQEPAVESPPSAEGFALEFDSAAKLTTQRRWRVARQAWIALLARHAGADYVRPRLAEIRELLRKSSFWMVTQEPPVRTAVGNALKSWSESSGRVELLYGAENLSHFERAGAAPEGGWGQERATYVHPLTFRGPYRITLTATPGEIVNATLLVALHDGKGFAVHAGCVRGLEVYDHALLRISGAEAEVVARCAPEEPKGKKGRGEARIQAVVTVDEGTISYSCDGKTLLHTKNEDGVLGQFGLAVTGAFGVLEVDGPIEASWIDGQRDAAVQSAREAFERTYRDPAVFAAWREVAPPTVEEGGLPSLYDSIELPPLTQAQGAIVDLVTAWCRSDRAQQAADHLRGLAPDALPAGAREVFLALCEAQLGRPEAALESLLEHERLGGEFLDVRLMRAELLRRLERAAEAHEVLAALRAERAGDWRVSIELVRTLMALRRFPEARAELERNLALGGAERETEELRTQLVKAVLGPEWRESFAFASEHFAVRSDLDAKICRLAADELEETWAQCCAWFGAPPEPSVAPTPVYLFSGEATYRGYIQGIARASPEDTLGLYSPMLDQIVAWNSADREKLLLTLRHECVHRYVDRALGEAPPWLGEGLADFVAASKTSPRKWVEGAPHAERLALLELEAARWTPLATLLRLDHEPFLAEGDLHYAQSWAFVHWLREPGGAGQALFASLWSALQAPLDERSALDSALANVDLSRLEMQYREHLDALLKPPPGKPARR